MLKQIAGLNQVFVCTVCARAFRDRIAAEPISIDMADAVVSREVKVPHPRYPDDPELATTALVQLTVPMVSIPEADAGECCPANTRLCSGTRLRFKESSEDGAKVYEIVGAEHLE